jgi:hypothetical protein
MCLLRYQLRNRLVAILSSPLTPFPVLSEHNGSTGGPGVVTAALSLLLVLSAFAICAMSAYICRQARDSRRAGAALRASSAGKKRRRTFSGPRVARKQDGFDAARADGHCIMDGGDGVVIDVEDCCQMTICDKACKHTS